MFEAQLHQFADIFWNPMGLASVCRQAGYGEGRGKYLPSGTMIVAFTIGSWTSFTLAAVSVVSGNSVGLLIV